MEIKNWQEITIESDCFEKVRENFDMLLQRLFKRMEQNNSDEGSITLKVNVNLLTEFVPDENGDTQRVNKPILKHNVSTAVPVKDSFDGKQDTGMELVYDEELGRYVLKYVSVGGQRSIFDPDFADVVNGTATIVEEQPALPGGQKAIEVKGTEDEAEEGADGDSEGGFLPDEELEGEGDRNGACGGTGTYGASWEDVPDSLGDDDDFGYEEV